MIVVAVDYRDETAFGDGNHNMAEIAEAVRHKKYGKDVREAIAQGFDQYDEQTGKIYKHLRHAEERVDSLNEKVEQLNQRCQQLEDSRATREELQSVKDEWKAKIEHVALGADYETVERAVEKILTEKGLI